MIDKMIQKDLLIRGESLRFLSGLEFKHLKVTEIMDFGYDAYMYFANCFLLKPQDAIIPLWGMGIYYEDITKDELTMMQINRDQSLFLEIFKKATNAEDAYIRYVDELEQDTIFFEVDKKTYYFGFDTFDMIYSYYKQMFQHTHAEKRFFIGEKTKKSILDEDYEEYLQEQSSKNKNHNMLQEMISFVVIENKRNWDEVYGYPIARLYEEYIKTMHKRISDYKMQGIYSGTIDSSKVPQKEINWFID